MSDLKKCPFCGGEAMIDNYEKMLTGRYYMIVCRKCKCNSEKFKIKENAVRAWNTRKPIQNIVEELEEQRKIYKEAWKTTDWTPDKTAYINSAIAYRNAINIVKEKCGLNDNA